MAEAAPQIAYPEWTEYRKKNGLDPLGMQTSSIGLYQTLLPGISNVTLRVRYYGLYVWLCRIYAREIGDTDPRSWQRIVRRAEALYALIAQRHGSETGVAGIQWATRTLEATDSEIIDFAADAEPDSETFYLKQAWGAYGAAYAKEVHSHDFGATWQKAELDDPVNPYAWQNWRAEVTLLVAGYYEIWARATDETGVSQPHAIAWNPKGYLPAYSSRKGHAPEIR